MGKSGSNSIIALQERFQKELACITKSNLSTLKQDLAINTLRNRYCAKFLLAGMTLEERKSVPQEVRLRVLLS